MDLESGLFRILDEALAAYLERPRRPGLDPARLGATRSRRASPRRASRRRGCTADADAGGRGPGSADLPPALAAMMEDRRADARDAVEAARREAIVVLPPSTWREIQGRAATLGLAAELSADGAELRLVATCRRAGRRRRRDRDAAATAAAGQGLVEYGLILALTDRRSRCVILGVFGGTAGRRPGRHRRRDRRRDRRLTRRSRSGRESGTDPVPSS